MQRAAQRGTTKTISVVLTVALTVLSVICIDRVSRAVSHALEIGIRVIVPALFPFAILSDLLVHAIGDVKPRRKKNCLLRRILGIPTVGLLPFFLGILCGFPIGVKSATELYRQDLLDEGELAQTVCFVNNTSPAFLIGGIGIGILSSAKLGALFYAIQTLSALLCGILFARIGYAPSLTAPSPKEGSAQGGLIGAIQRSALSCLWIVGSVGAFSALVAIIGVFIKNRTVLLFLSAFLEIGSATAEAGAVFLTEPMTALLVICIATAFGGASVHLQTAIFLPESKGLFLYYIGAKICQAAIAVLLLFLFFPLFM